MEVHHNMPFVFTAWRRRGALAAAAAGAALVCAAPAHASTVSNPYDCTPSPTLSQAFSSWADFAAYTPLDGGNFESAARGWTLSGGASVQAGNEPFYIGGRGASSLSLPAGSSAVSAPICIDQTYPFYRLFARNGGDPSSTLRMEVLFLDAKGQVKNTKSLDYRARGGWWLPTGAAPISVFTAKTTVAAAPISLRFTPQGKAGRWQIDDVFVDPYMRH
jgi:hypothetical protein